MKLKALVTSWPYLRTVRKEKTMYGLATIILFICSSSAAAATVDFHDRFEAAALDPFWDTPQGSATVTNSRAHAGAQSLLIEGLSFVQHHFGQGEYGQLEVYMYDDLNVDGIAYSQGMSAGALQVYAAGHLSSYIVNVPQGSMVTDIARTVGWRQFTITALPFGGNIRIDGTVVNSWTSPTSFNEVSLFGQNPLSTVYFDDFSYEPVPEPGTTGLVIAGLCAAVLGLPRPRLTQTTRSSSTNA